MNDGVVPPYILDMIKKMNENHKPRPLERQAPVLEALLELWQLRQDWRFGQLIWNISRASGSMDDSEQVRNLWNREDGAWLEIIKKEIEKLDD